MQKWEPDANPHQARRIGKTLEELGELTAVLARISIQGMDEIDPGTGKTNRQRFIEETADVMAQIECNIAVFDLPLMFLSERIDKKKAQMEEWESHFQE